ncbi:MULTISPECIES: amidoligase family protein [Halomonadaceae]|uniref:amidoligase family protein n=1 Tax=Halomonadaceae TaxID=28256 RepID=UPI001583126D|nr:MULTISPECIES: amidoligase family protein [Halomonas]MDI4638230.1 amidoligase family protein [Halomonas sp. BMC7]NUJ59230.1 amidoligase family protein [Halomonas taeanensis]
MDPQSPPVTTTGEGNLRRVGVEIEFACVSPASAANLVAEHFGGQVIALSPHRWRVRDTRWGEFTIELDAKMVHPDDKVTAAQPSSDDEWARQRHQWHIELHTRSRELLGDVVAGLVPTEIVCPPVPWNELGELDTLFDALRQHGAKGTDDSLLYGFGLHLNPEVPGTDIDSLLAHLRAYLLLAPWLRDQIDIDITREVLPHANPFPKAYALKVLDPDYAPDLDTLIADYLHDNPTRNREVDFLPLFAWLRPDHPSALLKNELVKPRPTFHYRLPNAHLSARDWGSVVEWNRWLTVERLAADPERLAERANDFLTHHARSSMSRWLDKLKHWMKDE